MKVVFKNHVFLIICALLSFTACSSSSQRQLPDENVTECGEDLNSNGVGDDCEQIIILTCGDGVLDATEECDDTNVVSGDGCDAACLIEDPVSVCGNGVIEANEGCDDGNLVEGDGCNSICTIEVATAVCGNGLVENNEECDDGNLNDDDGCNSVCLNVPIPRICGDGVLDADLGEGCDDGNLMEGDGCNNACAIEVVSAVCGNGFIENTEECDDGNVTDSDGCSSICVTEVSPIVCGNGIIETSEQCDDGNLNNGDGCDSVCVTETVIPACGDGILDTGETCDDGNVIDGDGCDSTCAIETVSTVCGNGVLEAGESCDDNNLIDGDGCNSFCAIETASPICGNGVLETGEECDDSNTVNGDGCSSACVTEIAVPVCGNGIVETGEECDDGNTVDDDACDSECKVVVEVPEIADVSIDDFSVSPSSQIFAGESITLSYDVSEADEVYLDGNKQTNSSGTFSDQPDADTIYTLWATNEVSFVLDQIDVQVSSFEKIHRAADSFYFVKMHPENPEILFAGGEDGLYKSEDGGVSFDKMNSLTLGPILSLAFSPADPDKMYAGNLGHFYVSEDGGDSFESTYEPWTDDTVPSEVHAIAVGHENSNKLYFAHQSGLVYSNNAGAGGAVVSTLENKRVNDVIFAKDDAVYIAVQDGLYTRDGSSFPRIALSGREVTTLYWNNNRARHKVFIGTADGEIGIYKNGVYTTVDNRTFSGKAIKQIAYVADQKLLFVGVEGGLYVKRDGNSFVKIDQADNADGFTGFALFTDESTIGATPPGTASGLTNLSLTSQPLIIPDSAERLLYLAGEDFGLSKLSWIK